MRPFRWVRPSSLKDVIGLLQEHGAAAQVLAGGTDLVVSLRGWKIAPSLIVDVKRVSDLPAIITQTDDWITIGATVTMSEIEAHEIVRTRLPALAEAAAVVGSLQIRNRATLVGNVCNASPAADTVPVLAVYGAFVRMRGPGGERSLPVVDFIEGNRQTALTAGELVTAVSIPLPDCPFGAAFARITRRRGVDLATVNLCCGIDAAGVTRFAFGAVSARPAVGARRRRHPCRHICLATAQGCYAGCLAFASLTHYRRSRKCGISHGDAAACWPSGRNGARPKGWPMEPGMDDTIRSK